MIFAQYHQMKSEEKRGNIIKKQTPLTHSALYRTPLTLSTLHKDQNYSMSKKKHNKIAIGIIIALILLAVFVFFPRRFVLADGGSVAYASCFAGAVYQITQLHRVSPFDDNGVAYYEKGTVITVFHQEIYKDTYIDYDDPKTAPEAVEQDLDNVLS